MADVFISYLREERDKASTLARAVARNGYSVWWDVELLPDEKFANEIDPVLRSSKVAIVLWSEKSVKSRVVMNAAELARRLDIIVPARLDSVELPLGFGNLITADLSRWEGTDDHPEFNQLLAAIEKKTRPPSISAPQAGTDIPELESALDAETDDRATIDQTSPSNNAFLSGFANGMGDFTGNAYHFLTRHLIKPLAYLTAALAMFAAGSFSLIHMAKAKEVRGELAVGRSLPVAAMSADGRLLAILRDDGAVEVLQTGAASAPLDLDNPLLRAADSLTNPDPNSALAGVSGIAVNEIVQNNVVGLIRGHDAPVIEARFVQNDAALLTIDQSGVSLITQLDGLSMRDQLHGRDIWQSLDNAVWDNALAAPATWLISVTEPFFDPYQIGSTFRDELSGGGEGPEMVVLPAGRFMMGSPEDEEGRFDSEGPQRLVEIGYRFAVSKYEVTWDEWEACVADGGCDSAGPQGAGGDNGWGKGSRPVNAVDWNDAQAYARWLSGKTGHSYRLLSEAEWEYAARAGTTTRYSWGDQDPTCSRGARNGAHFSSCSSDRTEPVGYSAANAFGLHDMHGNVYEWTQDCWNNSYTNAPLTGAAWESGDCSRRVLRGGSWYDIPQYLRSAYRIRLNSDFRYSAFGFRLARTL